MLVEFVDAFRFLAHKPGAGHKRKDLAEDRPILFWPMRDYLILYKPGTSPLQIITIVRGSRDLPRIIGRRGL
jgi:plasmid stabilization system protein ParE